MLNLSSIGCAWLESPCSTLGMPTPVFTNIKYLPIMNKSDPIVHSHCEFSRFPVGHNQGICNIPPLGVGGGGGLWPPEKNSILDLCNLNVGSLAYSFTWST